MKKGIFMLLIPMGICFSSCQKDPVAPEIKQYLDGQKLSTTTTTGTGTTTTASGGENTNMDSTKGYLRIQLAKDAINDDNILVEFDPAAKTTYVRNEDAPTFQGMGLVSLSSLSSDNVDLAINALPLTDKGASVALDVHAKADGVYKLNLTTVQSIPDGVDIWLMDKYRSDSLDFRHNPTYLFDLYENDTSSYGSHRFRVVVRKH